MTAIQDLTITLVDEFKKSTATPERIFQAVLEITPIRVFQPSLTITLEDNDE